MPNKIIIGIIGENASGKTTATDYLKEKFGAVSFRFSDMLGDILKRLYLEHSRSNFQTLSTILRQNFSEDIMSRVIAEDVNNSAAILIITEGV
ncbi:MAG: AAA family ATPase, partial [Patescibacteria group bacterium]